MRYFSALTVFDSHKQPYHNCTRAENSTKVGLNFCWFYAFFGAFCVSLEGALVGAVPEAFLFGQRHHGDYRPDLRDGAWVLVLEKSPICQYLDMLIFTPVCLRMGLVGSRTWKWVIPLLECGNVLQVFWFEKFRQVVNTMHLLVQASYRTNSRGTKSKW